MARPRKPAIIRSLEGNAGRRPLPDDLPALGTPLPSPTLSITEQRHWWTVVDALPTGLLGKADEAVLNRLAIILDRLDSVAERLRDEGLTITDKDGATRRNPLLLVEKAASDEFHRLAGALGLSPLARTRLATAAKSSAPDPLESLLQHWEGAGANVVPMPARRKR